VAALTGAARAFTGLAAAYSLDQGGDVILPGAFKRTIADWRTSKRILPLIDSHNRFSVRNVVGKLVDALETDEGLETTFQVIDGPDGDEVLRRLKGGFVDGLSIGYDPIGVRLPTPAERARWPGVERILPEVRLREVSVVVFPMNLDATVDTATVKTPAEVNARERFLAALTVDDTGLRPDDPRRLAMEHRCRELALATRMTRAGCN